LRSDSSSWRAAFDWSEMPAPAGLGTPEGIGNAPGRDDGGGSGGAPERRGRCEGGGGGTLRVVGLLPGTGGSGGAELSAGARGVARLVFPACGLTEPPSGTGMPINVFFVSMIGMPSGV
jgi:hypothetical protein